ncbi:MAG: hypothetical protein CL398_07365 [Acidiferrobacteraceae bacterium]|nr:hypothetical protein [Acidiferrobacteraceae bacterium]
MRLRDINKLLAKRNLGLVLQDSISTSTDFHITNIARFFYYHWDEKQQKIPDADIHSDALKYEFGNMNEINEVFDKYSWLDVQREVHPPYVVLMSEHKKKMSEGGGNNPGATEKDGPTGDNDE